MELLIARPKPDDSGEIAELLENTLIDLYQREGIIKTHPDVLKFEYKAQCRVLSDYFSNREKVFDFLIAKDKDKIIGTTALGVANSIIRDNLEFDAKKTPELKAVYILPEYQNRSVGKLLFTNGIRSLKKSGFKTFCLDCGYRQSQSYWTHRLGKPAKILSDYWGDGAHHMIWLGDTASF